jgi:hypothetical protein
MVADVDPERLADGEIFVRPIHHRVLRGYMERRCEEHCDSLTFDLMPPANLLPCEVGGDVSGNGDHEALTLVSLDHAHNPQDERH